MYASAILQASGCSAEVTEEDVEEGEVDKLVKGLLQQVTEVDSRLATAPYTVAGFSIVGPHCFALRRACYCHASSYNIMSGNIKSAIQ